MKLTLATLIVALAFSSCNLSGRRSNNNANTAPTGEIAESSATPAETPPPQSTSPSPSPQASTSARNANQRVFELRDVPRPPTDIQTAPPPVRAAPGMPGVSQSMTNANRDSAASVPRRPTTISGGVLNGKATSLPKPAYPPIAKAARASGAVNVQVTIDESGNVISASAVSGHPLLRQSAITAARQAKFRPTVLSGQPVKVTGVIVYNFVAQ